MRDHPVPCCICRRDTFHDSAVCGRGACVELLAHSRRLIERRLAAKVIPPQQRRGHPSLLWGGRDLCRGRVIARQRITRPRHLLDRSGAVLPRGGRAGRHLWQRVHSVPQPG